MRAAESGYGLVMHVAEHYFGSIYYTVALHNHNVQFVMTPSLAMLHMCRGFCTLVLSFCKCLVFVLVYWVRFSSLSFLIYLFMLVCYTHVFPLYVCDQITPQLDQ